MAPKGYTNSELAQKRLEKHIRMTLTLTLLQILLVITNIVLAALSLGLVAVGSLVIYLTLYGVYVHCVDLMESEGYAKARFYKSFRYISLALFTVSFLAGLFSSTR